MARLPATFYSTLKYVDQTTKARPPPLRIQPVARLAFTGPDRTPRFPGSAMNGARSLSCADSEPKKKFARDKDALILQILGDHSRSQIARGLRSEYRSPRCLLTMFFPHKPISLCADML
jgi:hypothetical protein